MLEKQASELQSNISVTEDGSVTGTLNYLQNYDKFSQGAKGNFLGLIIKEAKEGKTVTTKITGKEATGKVVTLTDDGIIIYHVHDNDNKISIMIGDTTKELTLTGLTLSPGS